MEKALGKAHPAVINLKWGRETILMHSPGGKPAFAELKKLLEGMVQDLKDDPDYGEECFEVAAVQVDLSMAYSMNGLVTEAEELAKHTYDLALKSRGEDDVLTCLAAMNMANALEGRHQVKLAKKFLDIAIKGLEPVFGDEHMRTLGLRVSRTHKNIPLGQFSKAESELIEVSEKCRKIVGEYDGAVLTQPKEAVSADDFPYNVPLVNLLILESTAIQAQSQLDNDGSALNEAEKDVGRVIDVLNKVLGKEEWPTLNPDEGMRGGYLQHAMDKGWRGSVETLVTLGASNARDGLHYREAIRIAKQKKPTHIASILAEHQILCGRVPDSSEVLDVNGLCDFLTGDWRGHEFDYRPPSFEPDKFKKTEISLSARPNVSKPGCLVLTGTGSDIDFGQVKAEGEAFASGDFFLYVGLGEEETSGFKYSGTVNISRKAIGGIVSLWRNPV